MPKNVNNNTYLPNLTDARTEYSDAISDDTVRLALPRIIPDVVDNITGEAKLQVFFGEDEVTDGVEVSLAALAREPTIRISGLPSGSHALHTLVLVDPDMPSPNNPKYKDTLYWMVSNMSGTDISQADFIVEYMPPEPGKGRHRYAFLLFRHRDNHLLQMAPPAKRISFQTRQWAKEHNMGDPVAGLYCYANHAE